MGASRFPIRRLSLTSRADDVSIDFNPVKRHSDKRPETSPCPSPFPVSKSFLIHVFSAIVSTRRETEPHNYSSCRLILDFSFLHKQRDCLHAGTKIGRRKNQERDRLRESKGWTQKKKAWILRGTWGGLRIERNRKEDKRGNKRGRKRARNTDTERERETSGVPVTLNTNAWWMQTSVFITLLTQDVVKRTIAEDWRFWAFPSAIFLRLPFYFLCIYELLWLYFSLLQREISVDSKGNRVMCTDASTEIREIQETNRFFFSLFH